MLFQESQQAYGLSGKVSVSGLTPKSGQRMVPVNTIAYKPFESAGFSTQNSNTDLAPLKAMPRKFM